MGSVTVKRKRDTQRRKADTAENRWEAEIAGWGLRRQFIDFSHMEAYVQTVWLWARRNYEALGVPLYDIIEPELRKRMRGKSSFTRGRDGVVWIASGTKHRAGHWTDHNLLHEIAHVWTPDDPGHGREWAALYLKLVHRWMGAPAASKLRTWFKAHKVKYQPKRVLSAERKAELSKRMKLMRMGLTSSDIAAQTETNAL